MYDVNEYVVCEIGVGKIMDINEQEVCIKLYPHSEEVIIALEQIKRRICLKKEILDVIDRIAYIRVLPIESEKYIKEIYQEAMDEYNEMKWVEIIKTEYLRRKRQKVHSFEKNMQIGQDYFYIVRFLYC